MVLPYLRVGAARELDLHELLNPKYIGRFGVHYRVDWFLSNKYKVSILLKLMWAVIFPVPLTLLIAPLLILRKPILRLIRNGDVAVGLFLLGIVGLGIGFVCDDTLRGTHFIYISASSKHSKLDETFEILEVEEFVHEPACNSQCFL